MVKPHENMIPRGDDPTGFGHYGAKRGTRKHKGFDVAVKKGDNVFSPIHGTVTKLGYPYANDLEYRYIEISNDIYRWRLMYVEPRNLEINERIQEGQMIGVAQAVSEKWNPAMIDHVHHEVYKHGLLTDPEPILKYECK